MLIERAWNARIPLVNKDNDFLWHFRAFGPGSYNPQPDRLILLSPDNQQRTLIAIDDDPQQRGFELFLELRQSHVSQEPLAIPNSLGVFFGWREADGSNQSPPRFFLIELDERPLRENGLNEPHGRVTLTTGVVVPAKGARGAWVEWSRPVRPASAGIVPLAKSGLDWHKLALRAVDGAISLRVDDLPAREFKLAALKAADDTLESVQLHGALGLWTQQGTAEFRNITITAIPSGKARP
jgi:hypothetical protein